jgi:hypothetical protein
LDQRKEEGAEKAIALGLGGGVAALILGVLLVLLGMVTQMGIVVAFAFLLILAGVIVLAVSLGTGLKRNKSQFDGPQTTYEDVKIVVRAAYNDQAQLVTSDWDLEEPGVRFYVKVELRPGNRIEFECARETFYSCGEGMSGSVNVRGKWLGLFTPAPRPIPVDE